MLRSAVLYAMKSFRIRGFDGLRALAFLLVFISHKAPSPVSERYGTAGVWVFFVLSGFLITRILAEARGGIDAGRSNFRSSLSRFYVRRTARIFPVYYVFLAVVTVAGLWGLVEVGSPARQLSNWFYLSNIYIGLNGWETRLGHLWSSGRRGAILPSLCTARARLPAASIAYCLLLDPGRLFDGACILAFHGSFRCEVRHGLACQLRLDGHWRPGWALGRQTPAPAPERRRTAGTHACAYPRDARLVQFDRSLDLFCAFDVASSTDCCWCKSTNCRMDVSRSFLIYIPSGNWASSAMPHTCFIH